MTSARRRTTSLRLRVTALSAVIIAITLAIAGVFVANWLRSSLLADADEQLFGQAAFVAELAQRSQLSPTLTATGVDTGQVQVIAADGTVLAVSPGLATSVRLDVFAAPAAGQQQAHTVPGPIVGGNGTTDYRVVARTVDTPAGPISVYAASSLQAVDGAVDALVFALWVGAPLLTLLGAAGIWIVVGRSLSPVERMRREVAALPGDRPHDRISAHVRATELESLATTMNGLLDRVDRAAAVQREFIADASHELRSPLASVRTQLEVGLAYPLNTDWPATARDALVDVERLQALAGELLERARVEAATDRTFVATRLDLAALVTGELARYGDARLVLRATSVQVAGDAALLVRLLRNLVDNALRHAAARVEVTVASDGADPVRSATIRVWNDGEAVPDVDRERVFLPFTRLDSSRASDAAGAGLGLSIARRIAEVHGGTLTVEPSPHGALFVARLPVAG